MEISKKVFIRGKHALKRLRNIQKLADRLYHGNFSLMINDILNRRFNLDPETGEELDVMESMVAEPKAEPYEAQPEKPKKPKQ